MTLLVSGISQKDGKKVAHVTFDDNNRIAEGTIPDCKITSNKGFTDEEIQMLEEYMQDNLAMLKRKAAEINPIKALMKD